MLAVYLAVLRWVASSTGQRDRSGGYYPFRLFPDVVAEPLSSGVSAMEATLGIGCGLILVPLYSLIAVLVLVVIIVNTPHRPYSIDLFFASLLALFCVETEVGLLAILLTSLMALIETAVRRLSRRHVIGSVLALGIGLGLYMTAYALEAIANI